MDAVILVFILGMCVYEGTRVYNCEERNKVFCKYPIQVTDVQKYNHQCGILIYVFGVVADFTLLGSIVTSGWVSLLFVAAIVLEAVIVVQIYRKGIEKKLMVKR